MLLQFNFQNFKSFRDDSTLDMTATRITELNHHVVSIGTERVLPVAALYGANASGKSNVYEAFWYMSQFVILSFGFGDESEKRENSRFRPPTPFLFDAKSRKAESLFEVYFINTEGTRTRYYNYGFTLDRDGIHEEWLNYKSKTSRSKYRRIFYRNGEQLDMPRIASKSQENIRIALNKETLVVSLGAKLRIQSLRVIRNWFLNNEIADFGRPEENYFLSQLLPENFVENKEVQDNVVAFFSTFDPSIVGFEVETIRDEHENKPNRIRIDAIHRIIGTDQVANIPLKHESAGTLKMFALYPLLQNVLKTGGVLFVDELNSRLHPLLVRVLIITFLDPEINPMHAQLVFTTHDAWQLASNILRRDEIWFVEKTPDGVSSLYSLADFVDEDGTKIRSDENYQKNYLLGKYGAIPAIKNLDMLLAGDHNA